MTHYAPPMPGTMLVCTSHAPLMLIRPRAPAEEPMFLEHRARVKEMVERFDPDQIVFFGNNHFAGIHYSLMPPFCIGLQAHAVADLGGFEGDLNVPAEDAKKLLVHMREEGFDPAVSYKMTVDHAFSQPLGLITGLDRYPVIPVFISVFTPPFMSFKRSRLFGEAVGRHLAASGKRTLIMASGGLSHHPVRYFPLLDDASPEVLAYQMDGDRGGTMTDEQWFKRFSEMHIEGAELASTGRRTAAQMRLNPDVDRRVIGQLAEGKTGFFDQARAEDLVEQAGVGLLETHAWIAATAAHGAAHGFDGGRKAEWVYAPVVEYGIGFGMMYSTDAAA